MVYILDHPPKDRLLRARGKVLPGMGSVGVSITEIQGG
jgi:hypothetical protein